MAEASVASDYLATTAYERGKDFVHRAKEAAADGLTWSEFGEVLIAFLRLMVSAYDKVGGMDGAAKKATVVALAAQLFDAVSGSCVPLLSWPLWVMCRPAIRTLVLALAAGAIESLLPLVRRNAT